jgi:hypothetical protein
LCRWEPTRFDTHPYREAVTRLLKEIEIALKTQRKTEQKGAGIRYHGASTGNEMPLPARSSAERSLTAKTGYYDPDDRLPFAESDIL